MNILFVINALSPGGAEVFVLRLAKALKEKGNNVYILPLHADKNNESFKTLFVEDEIKILKTHKKTNEIKDFIFWKINALMHYMGMKGIYNKLKDWDKQSYYKRVLKKYNIQVLNSHLIESDNFSVNYLKRITGIPVVITMHSSYNSTNINAHKYKSDFLQLCNNILNEANYITYVADANEYIFNLSEIKLNTPTEKIYIGFEPSNKTDSFTEAILKKINTPVMKFGMIGRGIKEKGWEIAINAFVLLQKNYSAIQLILVCPETDYIQFLKNKYKLNSAIVFTGQLNNPEPVIKKIDIALLPSYSESLPVSIIEALTFGMPVIATDVGEIKQMLTDDDGNIAGAVFPKKEGGIPSADKLFELMKVYLDFPEKLSEHKKRALSASKKFSMDECVEKYLKIYQQLVNK